MTTSPQDPVSSPGKGVAALPISQARTCETERKPGACGALHDVSPPPARSCPLSVLPNRESLAICDYLNLI